VAEVCRTLLRNFGCCYPVAHNAMRSTNCSDI
jgi:hypothetical protein